MEYEDFIERMKGTSVEDLFRARVVQDNYPVLFDGQYDEVADDISKNRGLGLEYKTIELNKKGLTAGKIISGFSATGDEDDSVLVQMENRVTNYSSSGIPEEDLARQYKNYSILLLLHTNDVHKKSWPGLVSVIEDLCNYAKKNNIPFCLPFAGAERGSLVRGNAVYWEPELI